MPDYSNQNTYKTIYNIVCRIPYGQVATYGQIARLAGKPGQARQVGYALSALHDPEVPWHRVINARGSISSRSNSDFEIYQRTLLESEGIEFDQNNRILLNEYQWQPSINDSSIEITHEINT